VEEGSGERGGVAEIGPLLCFWWPVLIIRTSDVSGLRRLCRAGSEGDI